MRFKIFWGTFLLVMLSCATLFAQPGEPCAGTDPDASCPLDTWVFILAVIAVVFAIIHLGRKRTAQNSNV